MARPHSWLYPPLIRSLTQILSAALIAGIPRSAEAETVPAIDGNTRIPSTTVWYVSPVLIPSGDASLFDGYATAQAACEVARARQLDEWGPTIYSTYGLLVEDVLITGGVLDYAKECVLHNEPALPVYVGGALAQQKCPVGFKLDGNRSPNMSNWGPQYTTTTLECIAPTRCPAVPKGEPEFTLDADGMTCSREVKCPIDPLPDLPKDDACTNSLEAGGGKDVNKACPAMTTEMQNQAQCLADKIHRLGIPYTEPSATIRTEAYQQHLLKVWKKLQEIGKLKDSDKAACTKIIADVHAHQKTHGIISDPSNKGNNAPHVLGKAIDIPSDVASAIMDRVTNTTFINFNGCLFCTPISITTIGDMQDYVNNPVVNPPPCNLIWGGRFKRRNPDNVHFQLP